MLQCYNYHIFFVGGDRIPFFLFRGGEVLIYYPAVSSKCSRQVTYSPPPWWMSDLEDHRLWYGRHQGREAWLTGKWLDFFFYERPGGRTGGFCHFRKSFLGWSALPEGHRGKGVFQTHKRVSEEILRVEAAWQNWGRKEGRYVQGWLEMSFTKNTSILVCTFLRRVKRKMEEVTFSGFVAF